MVGKKTGPHFFKISQLHSQFCTLFKKRIHPSGPLQIPLSGNSRTTHGKNFGVAFFDLPAISLSKIKVMYFSPLMHTFCCESIFWLGHFPCMFWEHNVKVLLQDKVMRWTWINLNPAGLSLLKRIPTLVRTFNVASISSDVLMFLCQATSLYMGKLVSMNLDLYIQCGSETITDWITANMTKLWCSSRPDLSLLCPSVKCCDEMSLSSWTIPITNVLWAELHPQ